MQTITQSGDNVSFTADERSEVNKISFFVQNNLLHNFKEFKINKLKNFGESLQFFFDQMDQILTRSNQFQLYIQLGFVAGTGMIFTFI